MSIQITKIFHMLIIILTLYLRELNARAIYEIRAETKGM
jgi:hypothetical protein